MTGLLLAVAFVAILLKLFGYSPDYRKAREQEEDSKSEAKPKPKPRTKHIF